MVAGGAFYGRPVLQMIDARGWTATTCEILSSGVRRTEGEEGATYRVEVSYRYAVGGQPFTGSRYKFVGGATSGVRRKAEAVRRLAPGTQVECFVNPDNAAESVIVRGPTGDLAFGLFPLAFAVVGAWGLWGASLGRGPLGRQLTTRPTTHVVYENARPRGWTRLAPIQRRGAKAFGLALFVLFWNGVVAVFVYQIVQSWQQRLFAWPLAIFMVPFVLVGLILMVLAVSAVLEYFNPLPHLTVNSSVLALGDELTLRWAIEGRADKLRHLRITLDGREEAIHRDGSDKHARRETFISLPLVDESAPFGRGGGTASATIPAGSMHSFDAPNNRVVWYVKLRGDVENWPDMDDEFAIQVTPPR